MKLNGTHQLLVYADDVNILARSEHTTEKKNAEALVVASKIGLEVKADKIKYVVISQDQNAIQSQQNKRLIIVVLKGWNSLNIWKQP